MFKGYVWLCMAMLVYQRVTKLNQTTFSSSTSAWLEDPWMIVIWPFQIDDYQSTASNDSDFQLAIGALFDRPTKHWFKLHQREFSLEISVEFKRVEFRCGLELQI